MPVVPLLSGKEVIKVFDAFGWRVDRQNGSHIILIKAGAAASLSVPNHKEVARGTLRSLIRDADLTVSEFISAI